MSSKLGKELSSILPVLEKIADTKSKKLYRLFNQNLNDIQAEIAKIYAKYTIDNEFKISQKQRLQALISIEKQLINQVKSLGLLEIDVLKDILYTTGIEGGLRTLYAIEKGIDIILDFSLVNPKTIKTILNNPIQGKKFSDRIWDNKKKLVARVKRDINRSLVSGKSVEKLAREIKKDFGVSAYESKRLINTEVAHMQTAIQQEIYKSSDVVQKVEWLSTFDNKTRKEHREFDGQQWDKNSNHPTPRDYVSCRCTLAPVVDGWSPSKRRENIVGADGKKKVINYTTFSEWKKSLDI